MKNLLYIAFIFILISSCTKFDNDDGIQLSTKKARITDTWKVDNIHDSKNNEVTIKEFLNLVAEEDLNYYGFTPTLKFVFEHDMSMEFIIGVGLISLKSEGVWEFIDESGIEIDVEPNTTYGIPRINEEYNIIKLSNSELWLEYLKFDELYEIHLTS